MPEIIGLNVDRVCTLEMRPQGMPRGQIHRLYEAAYQQQGEPLSLLAARRLAETLGKGDVVILTTGAGGPPWLPNGETDGPPGLAVLARALVRGLGVLPVYLAEAANLAPVIAASAAAGVPVMSLEDAEARSGAAIAMDFPINEEQAKPEANRLLDRFRPKAVICIEKLGPNCKGEIHSVRGVNLTQHHAKIHHLVEAAKGRGVLTIGVGDGGNEIGFGMIADAVRQISSFGARCQCPCQAGMAAVTATDVLVVGGTSNWGAYGVATCLAFLLKDREVLHDPATELRVLEACSRAGAFDGMYLIPIPFVDGTRPEVQSSLITILNMILEIGLKTVSREI